MHHQLFLILVLCLVSSFGERAENELPRDNSEQRSSPLTSILNPIGIVKTARRLLTSGVDKFRKNIEATQKLKESITARIGHRELQTEQPSLSKMFSDDFLKLPRDGVIGGIFRYMGMDSSSIGMIVLNVLMFVAEMITSNMIGKDGKNALGDTRMIKENIMEWFIKGRNEQVDQILRTARDSSLPDNIISTLQSQTGSQTACIQLLICKMSPFIWRFQSTLSDQLNSSRKNGTGNYDPRSLLGINIWDSLAQVFPDKNKFLLHGDDCEGRYPSCKLLKFKQRNL